MRRYAVDALHAHLPGGVAVDQAVMERREAEYDFNGDLLGDVLECIAGEGTLVSVIVAMLFSSRSPRRPGGDIIEICDQAMADYPGLQVTVSPLVGEHPLLIEILQDRLQAALES